MKQFKTIATCGILTTFALLAGWAPQARASLIAYDGFVYNTGSLGSQAGGSGWSTGWYQCNAADISVATGSLGYASLSPSLSLVTAGNQAQQSTSAGNNDQRQLNNYYGPNCAANQSVWISFTGQSGSVISNGGFAGVSLFDSGQTGLGCSSAEYLFIGKRGGATHTAWGAEQSAGTGCGTCAGGDSSVAFNSTIHFIVARLDFNSGGLWTIHMWVDPSLASVPSDSASGVVTFSFTDNVCFNRFRIAAGFGSTINVDELRVGTTYGDVAPVPAPTVSIAPNPSGGICAGTSVAFTATPVNGGTSPTYTWYVNGVQTQQSSSVTFTSSAFHQGDQVWCTITQDASIPGSQSTPVSSGTNTMAVTTLALSPAVLPNVSVGVAYNQTVSASGGVGPYAYTVTAGALPSGLTLSNSTGAITGIYNSNPGSATFTIQAADQGGLNCAISRPYTVLMSACAGITLSPTNLAPATVGSVYSQSITASGGAAPYTFSLLSGNPPPGVTLSTNGLLSGTPTAAGSPSFTVLVNDTNGCSDTLLYTLTANCPSVSLSPTNLPAGTALAAYNQTITASGGTAPYTFAISSGTLPTGISLSSTGTLGGTPTATGTFNITVRATDHDGCPGSQAYSLVISCPAITVSPATLPGGIAGASYGSVMLLGSGGVGAYTFSVSSGSPPAGLTLSPSGMFTGTPTNAGSSTFIVQARDTNNCPGSQSYTISVCGPPTITGQPISETVCGGSTTSFTATATGSGALTYAWRQYNSGWGSVWAISAQNGPGGSGAYIGTSTTNGYTGDPGNDGDIDTQGKSWGLYANSSNTVSAVRNVNLAVGETFRIDFDTGDIPAPGVVGLQLFYGGTPRFGFQFIGGQTNYTIYDSSSSQRDSGVLYTTQGLHLALTLIDADHYSLTISAVGSDTYGVGNTGLLPVTITGTFAGSSGTVVNRLRLYNYQGPNDANNPRRDAFFNSISFGAYDDNASFYTAWAGDQGSAPLSNAGNISGVNTPTMTVSNVGPSVATNYDVVVYNSCGVATSSVVSLTLNSNTPSITNQPQSETVCTGAGTTFSVGATGASMYQWRENGVNLTDGGSISGSGTPALSINSVQGSDDQSMFDVVLTSGTGCSVVSQAAELTVTTTITFTQQPQPQTACSGGGATFSVTANVSAGLTYQWMKNGTNLVDGGTIAGSATPTLNLAGLAAADNGASFAVSVSGAAGCRSASSSPATLTVNNAPAITGQPTNQTLCVGGNASFTVGATGSGLTYRWQKGATPLTDGGSIAGSATSTLVLTGTGAGDNGASFSCVVSGLSPCSPATSGPARLIIVLPPSITTQPPPSTTCDGWNTSFTVVAANAAGYQWRKNGVTLSNGGTISGATTNTLVLTGVHLADSGASYDVVISPNSPCFSTNSTTATLTVNALPSITAPPAAAITVCSNSPANFTVTAAGNAVGYQWRKRVAGWANGWALTANSSATLAGFYVGSSTNNDLDNDPNGDGDIDTAGLSWAMYANTDNLTEARRLSSTPLSVGQTVSINIQNGTVVSSGLAGFSLRAGGDANTNNQFEFYADGTSQYYWLNENNGVSNGPVNSYVPLTYGGLNVVFTLTSSNTFAMSFTTLINGASYGPYYGSLLTTGAIDRIRPFIYNPGSGGAAQDFFWNSVRFGADSDDASDSVYSHGGSPNLVNGDNGGGSNITGAASSTYTIANAQPGDAGAYDVVVSGTCRPAVDSSASALTVKQGPSATITVPSSFCANTMGNTASVPNGGAGVTYAWTLTGGTITAGTGTPAITFTAGGVGTLALGVTVTATDACIASTGPLNLPIVSSPVIVSGPNPMAACAGSAALFNVNTEGVSSYQWQRAGTNLMDSGRITGSGTAALAISPANDSDAGGYDVVITGCQGLVQTSSVAALTVSDPPDITNEPSNQNACVGGSASFTLTATGTALSYRWMKGSVPLNNGGSIAGAATATLTLSGLSTNDAGASYSCVVSGSAPCAAATSSIVTLSAVAVAPTIQVPPVPVTVCDGWNASFTVTASNATSYAWRRNGVLLSNGGSVAGATTATLTLTDVHAADSGANFSVVVSGSVALPCASVNSSAVALTVDALAAIATQPAATLNVCSNSPANFSVSATGFAVTYQWRKRGTGWASGWLLTPTSDTANNGFFIGSSTNNDAGAGGLTSGGSDIDTAGRAWGIYGNNTNSATEARRLASTPLGIGQTVSIAIDNGAVPSGGLAGFSLRAGGDATAFNRFEFFYNGSTATYEINDNNGYTNTGVGITYQGVQVSVKLTGMNTYSATFTRVMDGASFGPYTGTLLGTGSIDRIRPFLINPGTGGPATDLYINSITFGADSDDASDSVYSHGGAPAWLNGDSGGGLDIAGATNAAYTIFNTLPGAGGAYDVLVGGACSAPMDSTATTLTVQPLCLSVTGPLNESYVTNASVVVTGTSSGATSVTVNGNAATSGNGFATWTATVSNLSTCTNQLTTVSRNNSGDVLTNISFVIYATGSSDCNGDGLPDLWQIQYFGSPTAANAGPNVDPDGDGMSNLQEYLAGTDPTNGASLFHVTAVIEQGNNILVRWVCGGGRTNVLQAAASLPAGVYSNVSPNIVLVGSGLVSTNYVDTGAATNVPARVYRVRLVP